MPSLETSEEKPYVLLVEDEDELRYLLSDVLRQAGVPVITARDGADAINILRTTALPPVLVFTDLTMPRMDGRALVNALQQDPTLRGIPVVVLTGDGSCAQPANAHFILRKPFETNAVRRLALAAIRASNLI